MRLFANSARQCSITYAMRASTTPLTIISISRLVKSSGLRPSRRHSHDRTFHPAMNPSAIIRPYMRMATGPNLKRIDCIFRTPPI